MHSINYIYSKLALKGKNALNYTDRESDFSYLL